MFKIILILLIISSHYWVLANSGIRDFSSKFKSSTQISKNTHTSFPFKAEIIKEKTSIPRTAVLWQAPPYKSLAVKRKPAEELAVDQQAIEILLNGLAAQNPKYAKLQKQNKARLNHFWQIAGTILENHLPLVDLDSKQGFVMNSRENFEQINSNVYHYYQGLKEFYKPQINRDIKSVTLHEAMQAKLETLCGNDSVVQVEALLSGGRW